ncbi:MAG TPA: adenylate/guanylate cyclase domain-containing protein [Candidatus Limnocylindrales bacterium]|nr:adenylate/guanylate cyclase domain-containing protein [Candidatus Limnocylindrales bacterium]
MSSAAPGQTLPAPTPWPWALLLALPVVGLLLLFVRPELDLHWEHHPSHFWIVLVTAVGNVALAYITNVVAVRQRDARLVLVSLAFLASAGFLGLHALATPGVLLGAPNAGFVLATPVGLFIASLFAAASVTALGGPRAVIVLRLRPAMLGFLVGLMLTWAVVSLASVPPLNGPLPPTEAAGPLALLAIAGIGLFAFAAFRSFRFYFERGGVLVLAIAVALALLGEAMLAIAISRNWQLSWWLWHVLMLISFLAIALGTRAEYRRSGSLTAAFGGLYLEATLARIDRWHARAIGAVAAAGDRPEASERVLDELRKEGASSDEIALIAEAAGEVKRLDALFRPYLPAQVASNLRSEPSAGRLGGVEREVSVVFADLAGFTTFSETRAPSEVIAMLNRFWGELVPLIHASGGVVEQFAGDGVMASYNTTGETPDHGRRAADTALAIVAQGRRLAEQHPGWPMFRCGVNTGPAVVGNVGSTERRSFAVIGDTTNTAARLLGIGEPGQVVVAHSTWDVLGAGREGTPLGPTRVKGRRRPVEAWILTATGPAEPAPA